MCASRWSGAEGCGLVGTCSLAALNLPPSSISRASPSSSRSLGSTCSSSAMCSKKTDISCSTLDTRPVSPTFMPSMSDRMSFRDASTSRLCCAAPSPTSCARVLWRRQVQRVCSRRRPPAQPRPRGRLSGGQPSARPQACCRRRAAPRQRRGK
ncbi:MAG: hypothetical protein J3K34DRAFT_448724 [Monoraphidium minutum]|nr:MAG: hypothetical protein J3K34DRAFT_448724 [Monoraphidium minutum]